MALVLILDIDWLHLVNNLHSDWSSREWRRTDSTVVLGPMLDIGWQLTVLLPKLDIDWQMTALLPMLDIDLLMTVLRPMLDIDLLMMVLLPMLDIDWQTVMVAAADHSRPLRSVDSA